MRIDNSQLHALELPGACEVVAPTFFDDLAMPDDETLRGSLQRAGFLPL